MLLKSETIQNSVQALASWQLFEGSRSSNPVQIHGLSGTILESIPLFSSSIKPNSEFLIYSSASSNYRSSLYLQFVVPEQKFWRKNLRILRFQIRIAGREFKRTFSVSRNNSVEWKFVWDQRNSYGQLEFGLVNLYCILMLYFKKFIFIFYSKIGFGI